ncbi:MAG: c-type cytochrome [Verrucomicrobiaceae bacterium]|nr:c-type cytochrome [Verrucomicrobiaceae bacterium]
MFFSLHARIFPTGLVCAAALLLSPGAVLLSQDAGADAKTAKTPKATGSDGDKRRELHLYMKGRFLFQKHCVDCHGKTGRGNGPFAAELETKPRNFRTGLFKFRSTPFGRLPVKEDLQRTIRTGISGTAMPFFKEISDEDVDALIVYLQSLSRKWKDPALAAEPLTIPPVPEWFDEEAVAAAHAARGGTRFAQLCALCHGAEGKGDGQGAGRLMDAWNEPIVPADLSVPRYKSGESPRDLYRTIATGLNGTPMIGYADLLQENEIWELVAFIRALGQDAKPGAIEPQP